jgi:hypothetical protein
MVNPFLVVEAKNQGVNQHNCYQTALPLSTSFLGGTDAAPRPVPMSLMNPPVQVSERFAGGGEVGIEVEHLRPLVEVRSMRTTQRFEVKEIVVPQQRL